MFRQIINTLLRQRSISVEPPRTQMNANSAEAHVDSGRSEGFTQTMEHNHPVYICNILYRMRRPDFENVLEPGQTPDYQNKPEKKFWPLSWDNIPKALLVGGGPIDLLAPMSMSKRGDFVVDETTAWVLSKFDLGKSSLVEVPVVTRDGNRLDGRWWFLHIGETKPTVVPTREAGLNAINIPEGLVSGRIRSDPGEIPVRPEAVNGPDLWREPIMRSMAKDGVFMSGRLAVALKAAGVADPWGPVACRDATEEDRAAQVLDYDYERAKAPETLLKALHASPATQEEYAAALQRLSQAPRPNHDLTIFTKVQKAKAWLRSSAKDHKGSVPMHPVLFTEWEHFVESVLELYDYLERKNFTESRFHQDALDFKSFLKWIHHEYDGLSQKEYQGCARLLRAIGYHSIAEKVNAVGTLQQQTERDAADENIKWETGRSYPPPFWYTLTGWMSSSPAFAAIPEKDWDSIWSMVTQAVE